LRCERLVRSSLASSMAGFINGGRDGSFPDWRPSRDTSSFLICGHGEVSDLDRAPCAVCRCRDGATYVAIFQLEFKQDFGPVYQLLNDLGRNPALGGVGLPCSRADIIALRHWTRLGEVELERRWRGEWRWSEFVVSVASEASSRRDRPADGRSEVCVLKGWRVSGQSDGGAARGCGMQEAGSGGGCGGSGEAFMNTVTRNFRR
jgi:hypothetical protein